MGNKYKTAGIIVIGDEILKGHIRDTNSAFICKRFHAIGVKVCRIATVPDEVEEIAGEVKRFTEKFDIVITTGGIGPSHDDITYEAIASALDDKIVLNAEMAEVVQSYFQGGRDIRDNPALKMALIPQGSKLIYILPKQERKFPSLEKHNGLQTGVDKPIKKPFPIVQIKNVFVLPGMMEWLEHAFDHLEKIFENPEVDIYSMVMFLKSSEVNILNELNKAVARYQNQVVFGSYPSHSSNTDFGTKITLEATSVDDVTSAFAYLKSLLPIDAISDTLQYKDAELVYELVNGTKPLSTAVRNSLYVIRTAYKEYKWDEIYLSFNGGKDCTVLLHLVWAVNKMLGNPASLRTVYIKAEPAFPEVENFIAEMTSRYNLELVTVFGPIKSALAELHKSNPVLKAIFMGTRRTDPFSNKLQEFQMCDKDWPPLMRVNPILDWSYHDVWDFLRLLSVPYCSLYDEGYTSIGHPKNTSPNPALKLTDRKYSPAYKLTDGTLERQGRK